MGRLFGTDGARGVAITELSCEIAMNIGRAAATVLTKENKHRSQILIGKDTRLSSDVLEAALAAGICSVGADVILLGVVPTPAVALLVKQYGADAGIMISASHNSFEDNGIKIFSKNGFKLPDEVEEEIETLIFEKSEEIKIADGSLVGRITKRENAATDYSSHIVNAVDGDLWGLKIAVDCSNGSSSATARHIFDGLNAECTYISDTPNGININDNCGSTHTEQLQKLVREGDFDLGFAFDGDADRCIAVDHTGEIVDGDKIVAILAMYLKEQGKLKKDTAVVTVMSNLGFHSYMKEKNLKTVCTKVGDRYVLEEMLNSGYNLGGEQSGHVIMLDYATTGDGQLTATQLANVIKNKKVKLSAILSEFTDFPQVLLKVTASAKMKQEWKQNKDIMAVIEKAEKQLSDNGRVLVRESGTEPVIRIMLEGKSMDEITKLADEIAQSIKENQK